MGVREGERGRERELLGLFVLRIMIFLFYKRFRGFKLRFFVCLDLVDFFR